MENCISCNAKKCKYNCCNKCTLGEINVCGMDAGGIFCENFTEGSAENSISAGEPLETAEVNCTAVSCVHNISGKCISADVDIGYNGICTTYKEA